MLLVVLFASTVNSVVDDWKLQQQQAQTKPFGGILLQQALLNVLGPAPINISSPTLVAPVGNKSPATWAAKISSSLMSSKIRIRCRGNLACEYPIPAVELDSVVFYDGKLYLLNIDAQSRRVLETISTFFGATKHYLPSTLVQYKATTEWMHGPEIVVYNESDLRTYPLMSDGRRQLLPACVQFWDTSAYFHFPWENTNSYHAFNDNIFAILAHVVLQHVTGSDSTFASGSGLRTLFMFRRTGFTKKTDVSQVFKLLFWLFEGDVREARQILEGGPHCIRHVAWGTAIKVFYRDSLVSLRRVVYKVMQSMLRSSPSYPRQSANEFSQPSPSAMAPAVSTAHKSGGLISLLWQSMFGSSMPLPGQGVGGSSTSSGGTKTELHRAIAALGVVPRVVIVTRNMTGGPYAPARKVAWRSELELRSIFEDRGAKAVICCDFDVVNTVPKLMTYFGFVDICVGVHGAGLSNCALAPDRQIVVELQSDWAYGFDGFMKLAHMSNGLYVHFDIRSYPLLYGLGAGTLIDTGSLEQLVDMVLWLYLRYKVAGMPASAFSLNSSGGGVVGRRSNKTNSPVQGGQSLNEQYLHRVREKHKQSGQQRQQKEQRKTTQRHQQRQQYQQRRQQGREQELPSTTTTSGTGRHLLALALSTSDTSIPAVSAALIRSLPPDIARTVGDPLRVHIPPLPTSTSSATTTEPAPATATSAPSATSTVISTTINATVPPPVYMYIGNDTSKKFWIFVDPLATGIGSSPLSERGLSAILGPSLRENTVHCRTLPYYSFRLLTKSPAEHKYLCDLNVIVRQPNNTLDGMFLAKFVQKKVRSQSAAKRGSRKNVQQMMRLQGRGVG